VQRNTFVLSVIWSDILSNWQSFLDISAICDFTVLEMPKYDKFDSYPRLKEWMQTMRSLKFYEECVGKHSKAFVEKYQKNINS